MRPPRWPSSIPSICWTGIPRWRRSWPRRSRGCSVDDLPPRRTSPASPTPSGSSARSCGSTRPPGASPARPSADCEIGGYHVPRGTQIFLVQYLVHRDPRWFDEPEAFRPERWADDLIKRLPRVCLLPVRRRAADLHRQPLRDDGSRPRPGDDRPAASPRRPPRPDARAVPLDHAPPQAGTSGPA